MHPDDTWPSVPVGLRDEIELILATVLRPDELEAVVVGWAADWRSGPPTEVAEQDDEVELWARVTARGETMSCQLWQPTLQDDVTLDAFADQLEDFISESRFAWGEQRLVPRPWR